MFYCIMRKNPGGKVVDLTEQISHDVLNTEKNIVGYLKSKDARLILASYIWSAERGTFFVDDDVCAPFVEDGPFLDVELSKRITALRKFRTEFNNVLRGKDVEAYGGTYYIERRDSRDIRSNCMDRHGMDSKNTFLVYLDASIEDIDLV